MVWPKGRLSFLRGKLVGANNAVRELGRDGAVKQLGLDARYQLWRRYSALRFGDKRWVTVYGAQRLRVRTDDFRAYRISQLGGTQKEKVAAWVEAARRGPEVCVDVGANYGEFSVTAAALGRRVIAVEANPFLADCLRESFAEFGQVTVVGAAAADREGSASFFYNTRSSGSASLSERVPRSERNAGRDPRAVSESRVALRRLDVLVPELLGASPRSLLLKVDVEGFEEAVLLGAEALLRGAEWWRALIEFNSDAVVKAGGDPSRLWGLLQRHPGVVIGGQSSPEELLRQGAALPTAPPAEYCDVWIGEGTPGGGGR
jgi:FkbM family methyltransferase